MASSPQDKKAKVHFWFAFVDLDAKPVKGEIPVTWWDVKRTPSTQKPRLAGKTWKTTKYTPSEGTLRAKSCLIFD